MSKQRQATRSIQNSTQDTLAALAGENEKLFLARAYKNLELLEKTRLENLKTYKRRKTIGIPAALILAPVVIGIDIFLLTLQSSDDDSFAGLSVVVLGILYRWITAPRRAYYKAYKKSILPRLAHMMGLDYYSQKTLPLHDLKKTGIIPAYDRYTVDDYFEGRYKDIDLKFTEIKLEAASEDSKGRTHYNTVFKGLAILLEIEHKNFFGHTIMVRNRSKLLQWFKERSSGLERADLVDPEFEKLFDVYTNDQTEARYLIDPSMIENLKALQAEYEGNHMMVAYHENKMLIMIASKHNHFEPANIYVKATDPRSFRNMYREIKQILSVIDILNLYDPVKWQHDKHAQKTASASLP